MIKAVLLDLDDTLLRNPGRRFTLEYLRLLDDHFADLWGTTGLSGAVVETVRDINNPAQTRAGGSIATSIQHRILAKLHAVTGHAPDEIAAGFATFFAQKHHDLRWCASPVDGAPELVRALLARGLAVVIATNPLYPAEAIRQRLSWGNLPTRLEDYAFVSHAENMHFSKPNAAYYAEILGRVGVEPDEAVMVGDSLENDVEPASWLGLHASLADADTLPAFAAALIDTEISHAITLHPGMIEPQYLGNLGALFGLIDGIKPHFWTQHPDPQEWSPQQIVCHLLESETQAQRPRLERILHEDNPFLVDPGPPLGPRDALPCDQSGYHAALRYMQERFGTLALIRDLPAEAWMRPARHNIFGPTTLLEVAHFTAQHDRLHLTQLCRTVGNCI